LRILPSLSSAATGAERDVWYRIRLFEEQLEP
jgi:hypothetical protein